MKDDLRVALLASVVLSVVIHVVPYGDLVGRPLLWISTLAHELGHGLTAVLVGGSFRQLALYPDASGVAWTATDGSWRDGVVAAGGLLGPPVVAAGCFVAGRHAPTARRVLLVTAVVLVGVVVLWVRNLFGVVFVLALAGTLAAVARRLGPQAARFVIVFLGVQLALSVFSRSSYLFVDEAQTSSGPMPSDVARMAEALWLPYWFWGLVCAIFSVLVLLIGMASSLGPRGGFR